MSTVTPINSWAPEAVWTSDQMNVAGCWVDRLIGGALESEVWDEDADTFLFEDYVNFTPNLPDFGVPISWNWNRVMWDLLSLAGTECEAEGGTGLGMVFQSDFFAGSSGFQDHAEVRHQSKDYTFILSETPDSQTATFGYGPAGEWWQFDTSATGGNTIELRGDIAGKVEIVEYKEWIPTVEPYGYWQWVNAYAKAWSEGYVDYFLDEPYYSGVAQPPDDGYVP